MKYIQQLKKILLHRLHVTGDVKTIEDNTTVRINYRHILSMTEWEKQVLTCLPRVSLMSFNSLSNYSFSSTNSQFRKGNTKLEIELGPNFHYDK